MLPFKIILVEGYWDQVVWDQSIVKPMTHIYVVHLSHTGVKQGVRVMLKVQTQQHGMSNVGMMKPRLVESVEFVPFPPKGQYDEAPALTLSFGLHIFHCLLDTCGDAVGGVINGRHGLV